MNKPRTIPELLIYFKQYKNPIEQEGMPHPAFLPVALRLDVFGGMTRACYVG
jgi:hypothetical protein